MTRIKFTTRKAPTSPRAQSPESAAQPIAEDEDQEANISEATKVDDGSFLLLPEPDSKAKPTPADEAASASNPATAGTGSAKPKIKSESQLYPSGCAFRPPIWTCSLSIYSTDQQ